MEFSNIHIENLLSHNSSILTINKFPNNDEDHFFTLSENGDLKEWLLSSEKKIEILEECNLMRPSIEYLKTLNHLPSNSIAKNFSITSFLFIENLLILGYEDGLILTFRQERRNVVKKGKIESLELNKSFDEFKEKLFKGEKYYNYLDYDNYKNTFEEIKDRNRKMLIDDYVFFSCDDDEKYIKSFDEKYKAVI